MMSQQISKNISSAYSLMQLQRSMVHSIENILKEDGKFSN